MPPRVEYVWMIEERTRGVLVFYGAYWSMVRYTKEGIDFEVLVENDEFELWDDRFDYESDE